MSNFWYDQVSLDNNTGSMKLCKHITPLKFNNTTSVTANFDAKKCGGNNCRSDMNVNGKPWSFWSDWRFFFPKDSSDSIPTNADCYNEVNDAINITQYTPDESGVNSCPANTENINVSMNYTGPYVTNCNYNIQCDHVINSCITSTDSVGNCCQVRYDFEPKVNCGLIDGTGSCLMGDNGFGYCSFSNDQTQCNKDKDWGLGNPGMNAFTQNGFIWCNYVYDFSKLNQTNNYKDFNNWLFSICSAMSGASVDGQYTNNISQADKNAIFSFRDRNVFGACISVLLDEMYSLGNFTTNNPFLNINFMDNDSINSWLSNELNSIINTNIQDIYDRNILDTIKSKIADLVTLPVMSNPYDTTKPPDPDSNPYTISFSLSYGQYLDYTSSPSKDNYINNILSNLFRDNDSQLNQDGNNINITPAIIKNSSLSSAPFNIITLPDWTLNSLGTSYPIKNNSQNMPSGDSDFFGTATVTASIEKWSPMLLIYAISTQQITFSPDYAKNTIFSDTKLIPVNNLLQIISDLQSSFKDDDIVSALTTYCPYTYIPPSYFSGVSAEKYVTTGNSNPCMCYNSKLQPPSSQIGNYGAMCFDKYCDVQTKKAFGLNSDTCNQYCSTVYNWLNSEDANNRSLNPDDLDTDFFDQTCGNNFKPVSELKYYPPSLYSGIILTLLFTLCIFSITLKNKSNTGQIIVICVVFFIIFSVIFVFLSIDLAGKGFCETENKRFVCKSKISNINLPLQFCNYTETCECVKDSDCPSGCLCSSTTCLPINGKLRPVNINRVKNINIIYLIASIISFIITSYTIYNFKVIYKWNDIIFYSCLGGTFMIFGLLIYYLVSRTKETQSFVGSCSQTQ